jgi:3-dehydroquinate dehydratase-2
MANRNTIEQSERTRILILQGPNLNLLGEREPDRYGRMTLEELHLQLQEEAASLQMEAIFYQSNHEGRLVDRIHNARLESISGIIINAGALTHTSVALHDALKGVAIPFIEVHITNVHAREEFRHHSYLSSIASGIIVGFGVFGYNLAVHGLYRVLRDRA